MATNIKYRPFDISFSENEIKYVLEVTDPTTAGCAVEVQLYTTNVSGTSYTLQTSFILYPTADGKVYCHLKAYLKNFVTPQLPDNSSGIAQPVTQQIAYYYIKFRQITTATPNPSWIDDSTHRRIIIMGGVEQQLFAGNNFFSSYLPSARPFLTWQPSGRYVFQDEKQYLTLLLFPLIDFYINVNIYWTDGTSDTQTISVFNANNNILWRIKTGAEDLGLHKLQPNKTLYCYDVSIYNSADDTEYLKPYRYYLEYRPLYSYRDLFFFGSLGNFETIRVKGEVTWSIESTAEDIEHITGYDAIDTDSPQPQFAQVNQSKKNIFKGDAGWFRTKEQQAALLELMISKARYELIYNRWVGITNIKKSLDLRSSTDKKWSFPLEWSTAYSDTVFTPDIDLGKGVIITASPVNTGGLVISGLWGYYEINAGIAWYEVRWINATASPAINVEVNKGSGYVVQTGLRTADTSFRYTFGIKPIESHYVRVTPTGGSPNTFYLSKDYSGICAVSATTNTMIITQPLSFGVLWDLSLDGGTTYIALNIYTEVYTVTGLTSGATYAVTRRIRSLNGTIQIIPPFNITML